MADTQVLKFVVRHAGASQELCVDADTALVGSGAHCEIRLPADQAAVEQLQVRLVEGGVLAEVRSTRPPVSLNGVPFAGGRLLPESVLGIGEVQLSVGLHSTLEAVARLTKRKAARFNVIHLLGAVGFPLGFYAILSRPDGGADEQRTQPPVLFERAQKTCSEKDPAAAASLHERLQRRALTARERAPFVPEDGVLAVGLFESAAACAKVSGALESAEKNSAAANQLRSQLEADFHVHRVRLERALETEQYESAHREIGILQSFLAGRDGEYPNWLANLGRSLELRHLGRAGE